MFTSDAKRLDYTNCEWKLGPYVTSLVLSVLIDSGSGWYSKKLSNFFFFFGLWRLNTCKEMCVLDVCLPFVKCEIFVTWKLWLELSCFHCCLISALILCSYAQLRSFILLQDLIQKYEGDLSQLSKRCDEMKKLYSNILVWIILKCNENKSAFLQRKKEERKKCRKFPYFHMLYSYTVHRNGKKNHI